MIKTLIVLVSLGWRVVPVLLAFRFVDYLMATAPGEGSGRPLAVEDAR